MAFMSEMWAMAMIPKSLITIHASMTPSDLDWGRLELERRDREAGFYQVGYHFIIRRNGTVEKGRSTDVPCPHDSGDYAKQSVAIVLIGGADKAGGPLDNFTDEQKFTLVQQVTLIQELYGPLQVKSVSLAIQQGLMNQLFHGREQFCQTPAVSAVRE